VCVSLQGLVAGPDGWGGGGGVPRFTVAPQPWGLSTVPLHAVLPQDDLALSDAGRAAAIAEEDALAAVMKARPRGSDRSSYKASGGAGGRGGTHPPDAHQPPSPPLAPSFPPPQALWLVLPCLPQAKLAKQAAAH
jgi:hypothetical protein